MKLLKPCWVHHQKKPIFSIDIHPDGSRFATGGQGDDSGKIVVWNFAPVKSQQDEVSSSTPKILCEMTNHLGCVNCVRWSPNGKWLASGGDDALIMIWNIRQLGPVKSFGREVHEQWGCLYQLRGHDGDVLDLGWSPDGAYLASCSIDNSIIIWNATSLPDKVTTIKGHTGLVKGITWDPVGKYLASQSDDKSLRVWRRTDWQEEVNVVSPFQNCGGTTQMLRLAWSPDGRYLVSAHALNNDGPVAKIIDRSEWSSGMDFVGHRKAIEVVRFNPRLFCSGNGNQGCLAIGSRDRSLSVWLTNLRRPLVVTHDLFDNSILDIAWSKSGYELMVCSLDGTVAFISFSATELGGLLPQQKIDELFLDLYGCTSKAMNSGAPVLIEDPALLQLQDKPVIDDPIKSTLVSAVENAAVTFTSHTAKQASINVSEQVESRTKDGRRRITPLMIVQPTKVTDHVPLPFGKSPTDVAMATSQPSITTATTSVITSSAVQSSSVDHMTPTVTQSKDSSQLSSFAPLNSSQQTTPTVTVTKSIPTSEAITKVTSPSKTLKTAAVKRPSSDDTNTLRRSKKTKLAELKATAVPKVTSPRRELSRQPNLLTSTLKCPDIQPVISLSLPTTSPITMEMDNQLTAPNSVPVLRCRDGEAIKWQIQILSKGLLLAGNSFVTIVACENNSVVVVATANGRRVVPPFHLSGRPHLLSLTSSHLMVVTTNATISIWHLHHFTNVLDSVPITPLSAGTTLVKSFVTDKGSPVICLSNGSAYCYSMSMKAWVGLCDLQGSSSYHNSSNDLTGPLADIQRQTTTQQSVNTSTPINQETCNIAQLELQILRSALLNSPAELEHWVIAYAKFLATHNREHLLKALCYDLIGPTGSPSMFPTAGMQWSDAIVGVSKLSLLNKIIHMISGHVNLQRLYTELKETIDNK